MPQWSSGNRASAALLAGILAAAIAGCGDPNAPSQYKGKSGFGPGPIDADAPKEFSTTASGLKYRILRKPLKKVPGPLDGVIMHYRGWLDDGHEFESTYHGGQAVVKRVDELLPGWKEGIQLIGEGGMIELEIPENLAFGHAGLKEVGIPPHATLHVWIELFEVISFQNSPGPTDDDAPKELTRTKSGLQYRILRRGNGLIPTAESEIEIHMRAWLNDGTEVGNTYAKGYPQRTLMKDGIPGFVEGLQLINEGGMIELVVPPELAYGNKRRDRIPANSTLKYQVELNKVRGASRAQADEPKP